MTVAALSFDELGQTILTESNKYSKRIISKYGMNQEEVSELSSFLRMELWAELHDKPELQNIRIVRRLINLRSVDYFRSKGRFDNQIPFVGFKKMNLLYHTDIEYTFEDTDIIDVEKDVILSQELTLFIQSLSERQKQVLKLVNEGYGTLEIAEMLGVHINTPRNTMKKIKELAISFGLTV